MYWNFKKTILVNAMVKGQSPIAYKAIGLFHIEQAIF
jgi:hypothetical protein